MRGVQKYKAAAPDFPRRPLADIFLYRALVCVNCYTCAKFQLPSSITFRDKEGVPKFNVGSTSPLPYPVRWNFYVCSKYSARSNSAPNFSIVSMHRSVMRINVKNFNWSLTTVVRGQNDTSKTANITDTIFDRTYWYSPYQRRRFENRWDQTFCILLITDVLSVIESANLRQRQN